MSYNHSLLFASISKRLHGEPANSIGNLSAELGISYRTVQEIIYRETGKSFTALREEILMTRVKQLLISQPGLAIKEVSFALGFRSPRAFGRAVQRVCGLSPEELRTSVSVRPDLRKENAPQGN